MIVNIFITKHGVGQVSDKNWKKIIFHKQVEEEKLSKAFYSVLPSIKNRVLPKLEQELCKVFVCEQKTSNFVIVWLNKSGELVRRKNETSVKIQAE
jgi:hypothetical protein